MKSVAEDSQQNNSSNITCRPASRCCWGNKEGEEGRFGEGEGELISRNQLVNIGGLVD